MHTPPSFLAADAGDRPAGPRADARAGLLALVAAVVVACATLLLAG